MHPAQRDTTWLLDEKYGGVDTPEYRADLERLAAGEPLAYVIGWQPFLGLKIYLDSRPLIPRPETEWWTEQLLFSLAQAEGLASSMSHSATAREDAIFQQKNMPLAASGSSAKPIKFLDLCAGSGAIGCAALKYLPNAEVYFSEIDPVHKSTIEKNLGFVNPDFNKTNIRIGDLFEPFSDMQFDIIACNPPYIPAERALDASVTDYEPTLALRSGADGLDLIRHIALELPKHLNKGGEAWIECDSAHADAACALFTQQGLTCEIRNDQYEVPRVIVVHPVR